MSGRRRGGAALPAKRLRRARDVEEEEEEGGPERGNREEEVGVEEERMQEEGTGKEEADDVSSRTSFRRSGRQSHSLSQPNPSTRSSLPSSADEEIDFIEQHDQPDPDDILSGDLPASSSSHSSSPMPLEAPPFEPQVEEWIAPIAAMTDGRSRGVLDHQKTRDRQKLRAMYNVIIEQTRTDPNFNCDEGLQRGVQLINRMNRAVLHVTEEIHDAEEMSTLAGKGYEKARKQLQANSSFDLAHYLSVLSEKYAMESQQDDAQGIDWVKLGEACENLHYTAHVTSFVRGVFFHRAEVKQRAKRQRRAEEELKETTATEVTSEEGLIAKQTQIRQAYVKDHIKRLTKDRAVSIWALLLDPTSFVRTVENFFDFSFAVRDGVIRLCDWDEEGGYPMVRWKTTQQQWMKEVKQMKATLDRLRKKLERQSQGERPNDVDADLSPQARKDRAARRRAKRARREEKAQRLLQSMKEMEREGTLAEKTEKVKEELARQKAQAVRDSDPRNVAHFTPVLDYHVWSGMVIKLGLTEPMIHPMTAEEERRWAKKLSKAPNPSITGDSSSRKSKRIHLNADEMEDEEKEAEAEAADDRSGKDERKEQHGEEEEEEGLEVEEFKEPMDDDEIEFLGE